MPERTAPRYLPFIHNNKFKEMVPDDEGQWYRQEDYDALAVKLAACEADHKQAIRDAEAAQRERAEIAEGELVIKKKQLTDVVSSITFRCHVSDCRETVYITENGWHCFHCKSVFCSFHARTHFETEAIRRAGEG